MRQGTITTFSERITRLFERHPLLSCVGILVLAKGAPMILTPLLGFVLSMVIVPLSGLEDPARGVLIGSAAAIALGALVMAAVWRILARRGWASLVGFTAPARWRQPWLVWLPALYILVNLIGLLGKPLQASGDWGVWLQGVAFSVSVPLVEESVFRGLILAILLNRFHETRGQVFGAVLFSSLLFGLWHLTMLLGPHAPWQTVVANVVYGTLAGVGFAAVVLRTRSIWLLMAAHAGIVFAGRLPGILMLGQVVPPTAFVSTTEQAWLSAIYSTLACVPLFLYGLWLLRDIGRLDLSPVLQASSVHPPEQALPGQDAAQEARS